jgi:hypothetical protein
MRRRDHVRGRYTTITINDLIETEWFFGTSAEA